MSNPGGFAVDDTVEDNPWNDYSSESILEALEQIESRYAPARLLAMKPTRTDQFVEYSCLKIGEYNLVSKISVLMKEGICVPPTLQRFIEDRMNHLAVGNHRLLVKAARGEYNYDQDGIADESWYQVQSTKLGMEYLRELSDLNREFRRIMGDKEILAQAAREDAMLSEVGDLGSTDKVVLKGRKSKPVVEDDFLFDDGPKASTLKTEPEKVNLKEALASLQNWPETQDSFESQDALDRATSIYDMDDEMLELAKFMSE